VKGLKYSDKTINICFDEWGVFTSQTAKVEGVNWTERSMTEKGKRAEGMNLIDAALFGSILITFINKCDRVKIACQSIVIGSVVGVTEEGAFRQTTFYPFEQAATYAKGVALRPAMDSPLKKTDGFGDQPYIQSAAVYDEESGIVTVFAVNLSPRDSAELDCQLQFDKAELFEHIQLYDEQPLAMNTFKNPNRVVPKKVEITNKVVLPPISWNVLRYRVK
jgi:alpha-N-arabinofuranosidase